MSTSQVKEKINKIRGVLSPRDQTLVLIKAVDNPESLANYLIELDTNVASAVGYEHSPMHLEFRV